MRELIVAMLSHALTRLPAASVYRQVTKVGPDEEQAPAEAEPEVELTGWRAKWNKLKKAAVSGIEQDIHANALEDEAVFDMHERQEMFDPKAEVAFQ